MQCRGEDSRVRIVNEYNLKPIAHVQLLNGQEKLSCTNITLTDSYYCFSYESKTGNDNGSFFCGSHAAQHFLELIDSRPLPLFNPLVAENIEHNGGGGGGNRPWDRTAKQLNNAINLLVVCWDIAPSGPLAKIKETIDRFYYKAPFPSEIKSINTIISRDPQGRTLQQMLDELREGNTVRRFDFDLLNAVLFENNIDSHYG
jgi:hypothetical protein